MMNDLYVSNFKWENDIKIGTTTYALMETVQM